jgi:hypothetical protein
MVHLVDVARTISFTDPWNVLFAVLATMKRWPAPRSLTVPGMSAEWLAEHERHSAKSGGSL